MDFLPSSGQNSDQNSPTRSMEGLRRELIEMEILDPGGAGVSGRTRTGRLSKHIANLTQSLSSFKLPFRQWLPSLEYMRARMPRFPAQLNPGWIITGRVFAFWLVLSLIYLLFMSDFFNVGRSIDPTYPESVRTYVQTHVDEAHMRQNSEHVTMFDHIAGTEGSFVLAKWVEGLFNAAKLEQVGLERFDVYLNYPKKGGRRVAIIDPPEMAWQALIEEEAAYKDPPREQTPVFHGHSRSGNVTGPLIYANYGSREDFQTLIDQGIDLKGSVLIIKYHGTTQMDRALIVKAAEFSGAVGCIIYSDPAEDGFRKGKGMPYGPKGQYLPNDRVQRGAVSLTNWVLGDVLSSGFASLPIEPNRNSKDSNLGLINIPSIPLSWRDAQNLLQSLKGYGHKVPDGWKGGIEDFEKWTGDQNSPIVHLANQQDEVERQPIYNVIGKITGLEQPEKSVIVGNHRDAWCFGATDPGSGTAVLLEVVRIFGELSSLGWRPLRSIEFASWDGGEYNLIGSTEHVEAGLEEIRQNGIAYLNVDAAVAGTELEVAASPLFEKAWLRVLDRTTDPVANKTLRSIWNEKKSRLRGLGAGSDYVAFQDLAGTSSIDIGFGGRRYPYHSCYDNFEWMRKHGDQDFKYHKTLAHILALLILEMADTKLLPFDFNAYARAVKGYVEDLEEYAKITSKSGQHLDLNSLHEAVDRFAKQAHDFHEWGRAWTEVVYRQGGLESDVMAIKRISHNTRMANFETNLLDIDGGVS